MKLKKTLVMILLLSITIFMTGCWNSRELETLAIVAGFAIDKGSNGSGYHLTFETLDESGAGGGSGGGGQTSIQSQIIESDGNTLFDADRNALKIFIMPLLYQVHLKSRFAVLIPGSIIVAEKTGFRNKWQCKIY
jgi:hypothetical protein